MALGRKAMNFETARRIFEHTLDCESRVSTAINLGMLNLIDKALIEATSQMVSHAIAAGKRVWLTSDLHFLHANIIGYSNRPFYNVSDMTGAHLRLLQKVPANELLIFVGDMAMGNFQEGVDLIQTIAARKILVVGNHDLTREGLCRYERERNLFEAIVPFLYWPGLMGRLVFVSHYPAFIPSTYKGGRVMNYHGHLHEKSMESNDQIKYFNVGWDVSHGLLCL
jgi:calcineurin-like phosphoesterase family protein